ncbi:MAG: hypothetical protein KGI79_01145 [Patescibacteria group bacterium]|nr:hypothetical protein [Patescibacteria group bacterium]MDE2116463.1 hypothetical protein [Patescibacteria group bacterium]
MTEIIPAILPRSYDELVRGLDIVAGHAPIVQIDICDGAYVPSRTWPYLKGASGSTDQIFESVVSQEAALPHWEDVDFEFDLMTRGAHEKIPDFISAGASRIVVHRASVDDAELASIVRDYGDLVEIGVALMPSDDPATTARSIADIISHIRFVQVMGIEKIGFQGQPWSPRSLDLVRALRAAYPDLVISVDGGETLEHAALAVSAGANRLVVGSALFGSGDFLGTLEAFRAL